MVSKKQAINLIEMTLYNHGLEDEDSRASKAVLSALEALGMLPPETRLIKRKALRDVISGEIIGYMETSSQLLNVWEECYGE